MKNYPDLELLALLSRPDLNPAQVLQLSEWLPAVDFDVLREHVFHHRIEGCCYCNIRDHFTHLVPSSFLTELEQKYRRSSALTLQQFMTLQTIRKRFDQAGIPLFTLKGIPLSERLYGDIAKRYAKDIDLLIAPDHRAVADRILTGLGFVNASMEGLTDMQQAIILKKEKDIIYKRRPIEIELHIRLSAFSRQIDSFSRIFLNGSISTEAEIYRIHELIYLCWHANFYNFGRLKWLVDITLILEKERDPVFYHKLLQTAAEYGVARDVLVSIALARRIFKANIPAVASESVTNRFVVNYLCKVVIFNLNHIERYFKLRFLLLNPLYGALRSSCWRDKVGHLLLVFRPSKQDVKLISRWVGNHTLLFYLLRPVAALYRHLAPPASKLK